MQIKYSKIKKVKSPTIAYEDPAGIDIYVPEDFVSTNMMPGQNILISTGLKLNIPEGYYIEVKNRSSIASKKQLIVGACIIDNDYQGEVFIDIHNISVSIRSVEPNEKIAQLILHKKYKTELIEVPERILYSLETKRGSSALGSSNE